jgi:hypothetical protein
MSTRTIIIALAVALAPAISPAAQYVVSPTGSDTAAGTSVAPWKTLQHAADVVGPGDRVTVRQGNYAGFYLDTNGTAAAPIEFDADPNVLINQPNPIRTQYGINLEMPRT